MSDQSPITNPPVSEFPLPKINKVTRYYYNHREEILEKKRLARLAKKNISAEVAVTDKGFAAALRFNLLEIKQVSRDKRMGVKGWKQKGVSKK